MSGWRLRKSFGSGPFRVSVGRRGVSGSVGGKGLRVTRSRGRLRRTISLPGLGLFRTDVLGRRKRRR